MSEPTYGGLPFGAPVREESLDRKHPQYEDFIYSYFFGLNATEEQWREHRGGYRIVYAFEDVDGEIMRACIICTDAMLEDNCIAVHNMITDLTACQISRSLKEKAERK